MILLLLLKILMKFKHYTFNNNIALLTKLFHVIQIGLYLGKILFSEFSKIQYGRLINVYFI